MIKGIYRISIITVLTSLLSACEKKYDPDFAKIPAPIPQNPTSLGTLNNATPASVDYLSGIALNNTHQASVQVNVTTIGTYTIHTDTINNVWFDATGTTNNTGLQTLNLQAHGIPDTSGACNFTVKYGTSRTNLSIEVVDWWEFEEAGGAKYLGKMDSVFIVDPLGVLIFLGTGNTLDKKMVIAIDIFPATAPTVMNYSTDMGSIGIFTYKSIDLTDGTTITQFYNSERGTTTATSTNIQVSAYNPTTRMVDATFNGTAVTNTGRLVNIVNGKLRSKFHPL